MEEISKNEDLNMEEMPMDAEAPVDAREEVQKFQDSQKQRARETAYRMNLDRMKAGMDIF